MSQVEPVSSHSPEVLPARPPSQPSRLALLIWAGVALFCLVMFGSALGLYLWSRERFESKDLKQATAFKITYVLKGNRTKTVEVTDPAAVQGLVDALEITSTQMGPYYAGTNNQAAVDVTLPDGRSAHLVFMTQTQINRTGWGIIMTTPAFYRKINEAASKAEGKPIDILRVDN